MIYHVQTSVDTRTWTYFHSVNKTTNKTAQLTVYTAAEDYNSLYIWGGGAGRSSGTGMSTGRVQGSLRCQQGHAKLFRQEKSSKLNNYHPAGMTITI